MRMVQNLIGGLGKFDRATSKILRPPHPQAMINDWSLNPFTPKISSAILLTDFHTILMTLVPRIWSWIN